jgi:hypothetical protein
VSLFFFSSISFLFLINLLSIYRDRIIRAPFSDTISFSSANSMGMFSTGVLYNNSGRDNKDDHLHHLNNFLDPIHAARQNGAGAGRKTVADNFDTTSLRSQDDTTSLTSSTFK